MTTAESDILGFFRRYQIGPSQMLFFNPADCKISPGPFQTAMEGLMRRGLVVKERPKHAYSLTRDGYDLSLTLKPAPPAKKSRQPAAG